MVLFLCPPPSNPNPFLLLCCTLNFNMPFFLSHQQTARPVLYDAQMVNQMIADVDSIDLNSIGTHALHNTNDGGESDLELNAECEYYVI